MDPKDVDDLADDRAPALGSRRHLFAGMGAGLVLAASGLLLPADLEARRGRGRKPGEMRERRDDRRDKRQDQRETAPGSGLLKDIMFTLSGKGTWWVVAGGKATSYVDPGAWKMANFEADEGWLVLQLGKDAQGRATGYGIFVNNPLVGRPWWMSRKDVTVAGTTVQGGVEDVARRVIYEGFGGAYELPIGNNQAIRFSREADTEFKNFRALVVTKLQ